MNCLKCSITLLSVFYLACCVCVTAILQFRFYSLVLRILKLVVWRLEIVTARYIPDVEGRAVMGS